MKQHSILLSLTGNGWVATHSDPAIADLFGTDTIATAFTAGANADDVLTTIARLNPESLVYLHSTPDFATGGVS